MREKLVEILDSGADLDTWASDIMADRILAEFRCDKCRYWGDVGRGSFRMCNLYGVYFPDNGLCHQWEAK